MLEHREGNVLGKPYLQKDYSKNLDKKFAALKEKMPVCPKCGDELEIVGETIMCCCNKNINCDYIQHISSFKSL